jgi:hypothetical protein
MALRRANAYVEELHRHHGSSRGHRFSIRAMDGERLCGVAIVGRPVAREFDPELVAEVTRVCTDGTFNACSLLYGAAARACKAMGFDKVITYTLASENGASLRAAGFVAVATVPGRSWSCPSRPREDKHPTEDKIRWEKRLG